MRRIFIALSCVSFLLSATEVDNFTDRDPSLRDMREPLNLLMQKYFDHAIQSANQRKSCSNLVIEKAFYDEFGGKIAALLWTRIENDIEHDSYINKRRSDRKQSIYKDASIFESFTLHFANLGYTLKIGDLFVGTDKLGHFLQTGHNYYDEVYGSSGGSLHRALSYGEETERTYFGLQATGVYSYGDLVANYEGLLFWRRIMNVDLPNNVEPYFDCSNGVWKQTAAFDWADYVSEAWDEANNCSRYVDESMTANVERNIASVGMQCPLQPETCEAMFERYGFLAPRLISPKCLEK